MARNVKDPRKYQAVPRNPKKYPPVPKNPKSPRNLKSPKNPRKNPRKIEMMEIILTVIKQNKLLPTLLHHSVTKNQLRFDQFVC
jgi:hypothetical protein